jgi:hypothetical protein
VICSFEKTAGRGLPIGTLTSQYFANFYLDAFDHWVQQECGCGGYARYMDDFVIFHRERGFLEDLLPRIAHWLQQRRGLLLRELPQPVATSEGIPFLGYRVFPGAVLLARRARRRFVARMRVMEGEYVEGLIDRYRLQRRMDALLSFTSHASCRSWRRRVVADCSLLSEDDI